MSFRELCLMISCAVLALNGVRAEEAKPVDMPKLDIQLKDVKKQTTLVIKKTVKKAEIAAALGEIYPKIYKFLGDNKIKPSSAPMAKYKVVGDSFEMEAGVVVPDGTKGEGDIVISELPEGKAATTTYVGVYDKLPKVYEIITAWLPSQKVTSVPIGWEIYTEPGAQGKPETAKTEVYLLTEPEKKDK